MDNIDKKIKLMNKELEKWLIHSNNIDILYCKIDVITEWIKKQHRLEKSKL